MEVSAAFELLLAEQSLLSKLIYRNHNQHSSTEFFSHLKALNRFLRMLSHEKLNKIEEKVEHALHHSVKVKLGQLDLVEILAGHSLLVASLNLFSKCLLLCLACRDCLLHQLAKRIFPPLYVTLLAVIARIFQQLTILFKYYVSKNDLMISQLQVFLDILSVLSYNILIFVFHVCHCTASTINATEVCGWNYFALAARSTTSR
jgi:hypothetical protein